VAVALLAVGFLGWSCTCPCDRAPGAYLFGAAAEAPVNDWAFANQVPLCQIQISVGLLPHAINLNCMSTPAGQLYLSCSQCGTKRWSNAAVENGRARLRLNGTVYPVTVRRVLDPAELDQAWRARVAKLQQMAAAEPRAGGRRAAPRRLVVIPRPVAGFLTRRLRGQRCFLGHMPPACSLVAPCHAGASSENQPHAS
jgi:hypothetical protein